MVSINNANESVWCWTIYRRERTIDFVVQCQHSVRMTCRECVIRSIALFSRRPGRISRIKAPDDQLLIPLRRDLGYVVVICAIRWTGESDLGTGETLDSFFGHRHLRVDFVVG